jgi:CubicO group peptidase (beta-lactamase class C family)
MTCKFSSTCLKFSPALLFLLIFQLSFAQGNKKNPKEVGIDKYSELDELVKKNAKALGSDIVSMVWTDTLVYKRELGEFDARTVVPVESASKWLTAALVMKLVDEGKISLDDKVGKYIPIYDTYGKSYITIRHCLSHFTGIQAGTKMFEKKKFGSLKDEVESYAKKEIQTNPGTEFRYNDIGFNIAGYIVEMVSKKKFDMLAKQKLFNPLGMRKTTFSTLDGSAADPSRGAQSTAEEYLRFLKMLLNNGNFNGQQFLSEASIKELRKITSNASTIETSPRTMQTMGYALGAWVVDEGKDGEANALASAGISGTFPMVDWCRGYAFLVVTKDPSGEQKKEPYVELKEALDEKFVSKCK